MSSEQRASAFAHRQRPRIFCIGRNYARHIDELHNALPGTECVIFMKPASALVAPGERIVLPADRGEIHHELEVVAEIGVGGRDIAAEAAAGHIGAIGLGLDLTLRTVQTRLKDGGEPWERAKAFDASAPLGPLIAPGDDMDLSDLHFQLTVDGTVKQAGHTADMLVGIADLIAEVSRNWCLLPGDLIFTGTPEGVGPLQSGQHLAVSGLGLPAARWIVA